MSVWSSDARSETRASGATGASSALGEVWMSAIASSKGAGVVPGSERARVFIGSLARAVQHRTTNFWEFTPRTRPTTRPSATVPDIAMQSSRRQKGAKIIASLYDDDNEEAPEPVVPKTTGTKGELAQEFARHAANDPAVFKSRAKKSAEKSKPVSASLDVSVMVIVIFSVLTI